MSINPLHLLANVASEINQPSPSLRHESPSSDSSSSSSSSAGPFSPTSRSPTSYATNADHLHIPANVSKAVALQMPRPLARSSSSNAADSGFVAYVRPRRRSRKNAEENMKAKMQMRARRKELMEKATSIKSLDNSPVNERQLLVLRMIYDEITMYPCESWMVLVAIIIHRAYKQVKNWFSNERQKNRTGESIPCETEDGDKVRLRTSALAICQEWSDAFFEEVVMVHNYKVQRNSQSKIGLRRPSGNSDQ